MVLACRRHMLTGCVNMMFCCFYVGLPWHLIQPLEYDVRTIRMDSLAFIRHFSAKDIFVCFLPKKRMSGPQAT
jgi:hypothetical protein